MSKRAGNDDPAPKLKGARRAAVPTLAEFANLTPTFQTKKMNDRGGAYVGIDINGQWPCFAPVAAPEYMHLLHGKNLYQGASGAARQENICLALPEFLDDACTKPSDYKAHLAAFVDKVHAHVFENRVDYLGKKFAKYDAAMTKLSFSDAYKEADDGKPPFLRIVLSDKKDPPITLRKLAGETGAWTAATPGSIKNLTAGAAIVPVIALFGGIWIVGERYGLKWGLSEALILTNKSIDAQASKIPTSMAMKEVPDENPDEVVATVDDVKAEPAAAEGESQFANANYDGLP